MRKVKCEWTPGVGVGVIRFGVPVADLVKQGYLRREPHEPPFEMDESYEDSESLLSVDVDENGLVYIILCDETLVYDGVELIGRKDAEIELILGPPDEIMDTEKMPDGGEHTPWSYEELGLMIFFENGISFSVSVDDPNDDEP